MAVDALRKTITGANEKVAQIGRLGAIYGGGSMSNGKSIRQSLSDGDLDWKVGLRPVLMDVENERFIERDPTTHRERRATRPSPANIPDYGRESVPLDAEIKSQGVVLADKYRTPVPGALAYYYEMGVGADKKKTFVPAPARPAGIPIPGRFATFRDDDYTPLGIVKDRYQPMQNDEAFMWLEGVLGKGGGFVETAGHLHGGRLTYVIVDLGGFDVVPGDEVRKHLAILNAHDGTANLTYQILPARPACLNMLNWSPPVGGSQNSYRIRHTQQALVAVNEVERVIRASKEGFSNLERIFKDFAKTKISLDTHRAIIYTLLNVAPDDLATWQGGTTTKTKQPQWVSEFNLIEASGMFAPGQNFAEGTLWNTYNAITFYYDWVRNVRGSDMKPDNVIESKLNGHSAREKANTFEICRQVALGNTSVLGFSTN